MNKSSAGKTDYIQLMFGLRGTDNCRARRGAFAGHQYDDSQLLKLIIRNCHPLIYKAGLTPMRLPPPTQSRTTQN
jgi:hypothetical protein